MYLLYIDESGTSDIPGNTSHFVLAGVSIPIWHWKDCDREIEDIKQKYYISNAEIHIGWLLRPYAEQRSIADFEKLIYNDRRAQVERARRAELYRLQNDKSLQKHYHRTKKNYRKSAAYIHLTYDERQELARDVARCIASWGFARLFAECVDKLHYDPARAPQSVDDQSFEQIVSRFEQYLQNIGSGSDNPCFGLLVHDNNQTVAKRLTELMMRFHQRGTFWTSIEKTVETPFFVDSELTSMIQIADVCSYALRRYLEKGEDELFDLVFQRADRKDGVAVGVRHFSDQTCACKICVAHSGAAPAAPEIVP